MFNSHLKYAFPTGKQFSQTAQTAQTAQWNPDSVIGIFNPSKCGPSCLGYAYTRGRRCQRAIAGYKVVEAYAIVAELAELDPLSAASSPLLEELTDLMLCYQHTHNAAGLISEWEDKFRQLASFMKHQSRGKDVKFECKTPKASDDGLYDRKFRRPPPQTREQNPQEKQEDLPKKTKAEQEREAKAEQEREAIERARKKKEEEERQKERQRQETERREKERAARELRKKQEKEAAEKEWAAAWCKYSTQWEAIERSKEQASPDQVPWPTKSGKREDVTESNVRDFFKKAPRVRLASEPEEEMYCILSEEVKRWHTDKILSRFGSDILETPCGPTLNMLAKMMVVLWKEAKKKRKI